MNLNKSARYALYAALEMAQAERAQTPVTVAGVAARYGVSRTALAKVFQQLVRAGLASGARGVGGGYRLARPASRLSMLEVVAAFEAPRAAGHCLLADHPGAACPQPDACALRQVFDEVDELVRCTYASISLATLARRALRAAASGPAASDASTRRAGRSAARR